MKNLIDYAETFKKSYDEVPFNEVDGLVLAQLCYLNLDSYANDINSLGMTIKELFEKKNKSLFNIRVPDQNKKLLRNLSENPRFSTIRITNYEKENDAEKMIQFSATTFEWDDVGYIAFRGTDSTVVGWKEDFDAMFKDAVPSQLKAVEYVEKRAATLKGNFYVGGHSKGGNMAVYSVLKSRPEIQDRVIFIFDYDGPGVKKEYLNADCYLRIKDKIITTIPEQSLFGMVLYNDDNYHVIKSDGVWVNQHDPFNWHIVNGCFVYLESVSQTSEINRDALNKWLYETDAKQRELLVDTVYKLIALTNSEKVGEVPVNFMKHATVIYKEYKNLDKEKLGQIFAVVKQFKTFRSEIEQAVVTEGKRKTEEKADFSQMFQKFAAPIKNIVSKLPLDEYKDMITNNTVVQKAKQVGSKITGTISNQITKITKKPDNKAALSGEISGQEIALNKYKGDFKPQKQTIKSVSRKKHGFKPRKFTAPTTDAKKDKTSKKNESVKAKQVEDKNGKTKSAEQKQAPKQVAKKNERALAQTKKFKQDYFDFYDDVKDHTKGREDW